MTEQRTFFVAGKKPRISKAHNALLRSFDLGVTGAYVEFSEFYVMTLDANNTEIHRFKQPQAIYAAFEKLGCINVTAWEVVDNSYLAVTRDEDVIARLKDKMSRKNKV